ncbi:hypothetical protein [Streptomyces sp. I6]|uniref:hypothetical protein n=1 Tax=Streptomyces sp. I6 TaxID=2483113 RepID=UPI0016172552|nr:hypothetical protein [Streptomyces sp. I6]
MVIGTADAVRHDAVQQDAVQQDAVWWDAARPGHVAERTALTRACARGSAVAPLRMPGRGRMQ